MKDLSNDNRAVIIKAFNSTSRYLDDFLNINYMYPYFARMVYQVYPPELQLDKANTSDTEALFFDLHHSISTVCMLVYNTITADGFVALFNCTPIGRASDSKMSPT